MSEKLNLAKTALVMIDIQKGISGDPVAGGPYTNAQMVEKNRELINSLKNTEALLVFVHVKNYGPEALHPITDAELSAPGAIPSDFSDFVIETAYDDGVKNKIHIAKHSWGAFYGTDLDLQLRRRGIDTIVLSGRATTIGCDTTAREAYQHGYNLICVEDAMNDFNADFHHAVVENIFKRIARVRSTDEVLKMIE